jgi:23S rRNA C2498 (ribose-2'-O)-methylase RlmM
MSKIDIYCRSSFSGEVSHTITDKYESAEFEIKDGGIWIYWHREKDNKRLSTFYPNISIIKLNIED